MFEEANDFSTDNIKVISKEFTPIKSRDDYISYMDMMSDKIYEIQKIISQINMGFIENNSKDEGLIEESIVIMNAAKLGYTYEHYITIKGFLNKSIVKDEYLDEGFF